MRNICVIIALLTTTCQYKTDRAITSEPKPVSVETHKAETRQKIAVIDTGIKETSLNRDYLCQKHLHKDFTGTGINDAHGHGSHIASIIMKGMNPKTQCLVILKYYQANALGFENIENTIKAFIYAKTISVFAINYSGGGIEPSEIEEKIVKSLLDAHIYVSVAAGNEKDDLSKECKYFPACYQTSEEQSKYFFVVASGIVKNGKIKYDTMSNFGGPAKYVRNGKNVKAHIGYDLAHMTGTSQSTALVTQDIVKKAAERRLIEINLHEGN